MQPSVTVFQSQQDKAVQIIMFWQNSKGYISQTKTDTESTAIRHIYSIFFQKKNT